MDKNTVDLLCLIITLNLIFVAPLVFTITPAKIRLAMYLKNRGSLLSVSLKRNKVVVKTKYFSLDIFLTEVKAIQLYHKLI